MIYKHQLRKALIRFIAACETEVELMDNSADIYDAYDGARTLLGDPIKTYPGGFEGGHYHKFGWGPEDGCEICEDEAEEKRDVQP